MLVTLQDIIEKREKRCNAFSVHTVGVVTETVPAYLLELASLFVLDDVGITSCSVRLAMLTDGKRCVVAFGNFHVNSLINNIAVVGTFD